METPIINCETFFDTAKNTMTQVFSKRVKLVVDFKNQVIAALIDERIVDKIYFEKDYSIHEFNRYQLQVSEQVEKLGGL
jgi:hypothetical protein